MSHMFRHTNPFESFERAGTERELSDFALSLSKGGYTPFRLFLDAFREKLKRFEDHEGDRVKAMLDSARRLFPEPGKFSPSWSLIWNEYGQIIEVKRSVLAAIPIENRDGEWQVLIDNPFTNSDIVCYPSLSFIEAAYLYAYFRTDLKPNEYLRLQKIENLLMTFGDEPIEQGS